VADTAVPDAAVVGFVRRLRDAGIAIPVGATVTFAEALGVVDAAMRDDVYWAGRATLLRRPEDVAAFDEVFARCFGGEVTLNTTVETPVTVRLALDDGSDDALEDVDEEREPDDVPTIQVRWSRAEVLRERDFAAYSPEEFAEAKRLMADLRLAGALRRSRRHRPTRRGRPDVRRTVRRALRAGGEPVHRAFAGPSTRPRRVVLLCDVSGSMEPYARALVRFLHAAVVGRSQVEAFAVGLTCGGTIHLFVEPLDW
jgi:uncharacterized protein with von Willebrand factor type A (vWA) domain